MDKILELLKLFEKFGVKPGKIIGAGDRKVVPIKKPILSKPLNRDYLLEDVEAGNIGNNTIQNEIEDIAPLVFKKQLNDIEINNAINNLTYLDSLLNPTNIVDIKTKEVVKGLESLRPSIAEDLKIAGKQLEEKGKELEQVTKPKSIVGDIMKDYARFQKVMQDENRRGLTRATARDILYDDIKQGKIKSLTIEELNASREPIDYFRKIYGEDALEQLDSLAGEFGQMPNVSEANKFARSKFNFTPIENRLPEAITIKEAKKAEEEFGIDKETAKVVDMPEKSLMDKIKNIFTRKKEEPAKVTNIKSEIDKRKNVDDLIDEYNANQDRLLLTDEEGGTLIGYDEFNKLNKRNEEIANVLEDKGIFSKVEEEIKPEGIVIPFKKKLTEPEEKADGGIIRSKFASGGKGKKILDIITDVNKKLKGKKSMETVNPKTGEITVADEFVTTAEKKLSKPTKEEYDEYREILDDSENFVVQGNETFEQLDVLVKKQKDYEDYMYMQYKRGKLDPASGEQTEARMKFLKKKLEEASELKDRRLITPKEVEELMELESKFVYKKGDDITEENFGSSPFAPSQETLDNLKKAREMTKGMSLQEEMNMVLNQYDKSMFIKNEQGMVDVTNPENVQKMALLLKRDFPELYRRLEGGAQTNVLEEFDVTGRKPNASGGLNYLMGF